MKITYLDDVFNLDLLKQNFSYFVLRDNLKKFALIFRQGV